ncbi:MAG: hypothetical protein QXT81_03950, partial [Candidatus Bathyarchaeia archaeon]
HISGGINMRIELYASLSVSKKSCSSTPLRIALLFAMVSLNPLEPRRICLYKFWSRKGEWIFKK